MSPLKIYRIKQNRNTSTVKIHSLIDLFNIKIRLRSQIIDTLSEALDPNESFPDNRN